MFPLPFPIPSWALKAAGIAAAVLAVFIAIHAWVGAIKHSAVAEVNVAAEHSARVRENKVATITTAHAITEASAQDAEKEKTRVIVQKVPRYIARVVPVACVPWGLVRLHDAAVRGDDPDAATAPAGQPDDACSPFSPGEFAAIVAGNYGVARANAEQLNALEADIRQRLDAANGTGDKDGSH